jgi:hypothetical protein
MKTYMDNAKAFLVIGIGYLAVEWFAEALSYAMGAGR